MCSVLFISFAFLSLAKEREESFTQKDVEERIAHYLERIGELRVKVANSIFEDEETQSKVQELLDKGEEKILILKQSLAEEDLSNVDEVLKKIKEKVIRKVEESLGLSKDEKIGEELSEEDFENIVEKVGHKLELLGGRIEEWQDKIVRKESKGKNILEMQALVDETKDSFAEANTILQEAKTAEEAGDMETASQKAYSALSAARVAWQILEEMDFGKLVDKDKEGNGPSSYDGLVWKAKHMVERIGEFKMEAAERENSEEILAVLAAAEEKINTIYQTILSVGPEGDEAELEVAETALEEVKADLRQAKEYIKEGEMKNFSDKKKEKTSDNLLERLKEKYNKLFTKYKNNKDTLSADEKNTLKDLLEGAETNWNTAQTYFDQGDYAMAQKYGYAALIAAKTALQMMKGL